MGVVTLVLENQYHDETGYWMKEHNSFYSFLSLGYFLSSNWLDMCHHLSISVSSTSFDDESFRYIINLPLIHRTLASRYTGQKSIVASSFHDKSLLPELEHDVRNLDVLLSFVLRGDLEDDVLLVRGNGLLADGLDKRGHPERLR